MAPIKRCKEIADIPVSIIAAENFVFTSKIIEPLSFTLCVFPVGNLFSSPQSLHLTHSRLP